MARMQNGGPRWMTSDQFQDSLSWLLHVCLWKPLGDEITVDQHSSFFHISMTRGLIIRSPKASSSQQSGSMRASFIWLLDYLVSSGFHVSLASIWRIPIWNHADFWTKSAKCADFWMFLIHTNTVSIYIISDTIVPATWTKAFFPLHDQRIIF